MKKKVCVIGCGDHAQKVYGHALAKYAKAHDEIDLVACCDLDVDKATQFQASSGCRKIFADYQAMLETTKPDAVLLVTPFHITAHIAVDVIRQGYAIMLEKPPGKDLADCLTIAKAVQQYHPINMVAFNRRNMPIVREAKALLANGGQPLHIQHIDYQMYRYRRTETHFHTTAIHGIDMIRHIAGAPYQHLDIQYIPQTQYGESVDNMLLTGLFANGVTTTQSYCPVAGLVMERFTIAADDLTLCAETGIWQGPDFPGRLRLYRNGKLERDILGTALFSGSQLFETDGFYDQICEFFACVKENKQTQNDIFSAINPIQVADCLAARQAFFENSEPM